MDKSTMASDFLFLQLTWTLLILLRFSMPASIRMEQNLLTTAVFPASFDSHTNTNLILALRNIPRVKAVDHKQLTVYDVLDHKVLVLSQPAFDSLMERLK